MPVERLDDWRYRLPKSTVPGMNTDGILFSTPKLVEGSISDGCLEQLANVATLPGILGSSLAMPDIHFGYGFPVGGVAAFDLTEGVVSPGGIGYDINCGVRLIRTDLTAVEVRTRLRELTRALFEAVPSGVGSKGGVRLDHSELDKVLEGGARWAVEQGYGVGEDLEHQEEHGNLAGAVASRVSARAHERGLKQLGTLGSGNHFLEVQEVAEVLRPEAAKAMELVSGQAVVMLHTGSRGLGHQVATDYIAQFDEGLRVQGKTLIDRQLSCAGADSPEAKAYLEAMASGANFAWANRQIITDGVRKAFSKVFGRTADELGVRVVYDLSHNMAKVEEHVLPDGGRKKVIVHRKGATRAFPEGREEIPSRYRSVGQPVLIPGDMGTASYVLVGAPGSMERSFGSACHGAGRVLSRAAATRRFRFRDVTEGLAAKGIIVESASREGVTEEAPGAYKDVHEVVRATEGAGLARVAVRLSPLGVVKG
ncbi:MAG: RtcB family protein [Euryarchaeota archaeon]|nr:RtcB family protein [Euryarchaeota archaeon]MDE1836082.1 RtcB family protein [Euryarchaeota archaeon]MDE1879970.1 RtcB family protein [Euryarchaeota archaeon]MDE2044060.1 RtcB family protein [Thermoplasmata archaeon]